MEFNTFSQWESLRLSKYYERIALKKWYKYLQTLNATMSVAINDENSIFPLLSKIITIRIIAVENAVKNASTNSPDTKSRKLAPITFVPLKYA